MSRPAIRPAPAPAADRRTVTAAALALVAVTAVWGSTFSMSKDLLTRMSVTDFLGLRFLVAAAVVVALRPGLVRRMDSRAVGFGVRLGLLYALAQLLQFVGLQHTAATVSAFVVSMYVVFTPFLSALLLRTRVDRWAILASSVAAVGVGTMSLNGWALGPGELLTLLAAGLYAGHIIAMSRWTTSATAFPLTFVQLLTMGVVFTVIAAADGVDLPHGRDWVVFAYLTLVAAAVALFVQTWAQAHLGSSQAAVLMVLEPVWAAFFGFVLYDEALGGRALLGGGLVLLATLIVVSRRTTEPPVEPQPVHP